MFTIFIHSKCVYKNIRKYRTIKGEHNSKKGQFLDIWSMVILQPFTTIQRRAQDRHLGQVRLKRNLCTLFFLNRNFQCIFFYILGSNILILIIVRLIKVYKINKMIIILYNIILF